MGRNLVLLVSTIMAEVESILTGFTLKANLVKNLNQGKTYYRQARLCCYPRIFSQTCDFLAELGLISLAIESEACEDNYLT
ncbi:hypothetical protein VNO77_30296 [Canavalia gladiata]